MKKQYDILDQNVNHKWMDGLQALRGILFILVFISHSGSFIGNYGTIGATAVCIYFVLSGFLSGYYYKENHGNILLICIKEVWRKLKKFYPLYFIFMIIAAVLQIKYSSFEVLIKCLFMTQSYWINVDTALALNWPSWFLSSIMLSYFLSPIINALFKKSQKYSVVLLGIFVSLIYIWSFVWLNDGDVYGRGYYFVYIFPTARVLDFCVGIILSQCFNKYEKKYSKIKIIDFIDSLGLLIFILSISLYTYVPSIFQYTALWIIDAIILVWIFANNNSKISKFLTNNFFLWVGSLSFELYIVHRVIMFCYAYINSSILFWFLSFISTILVAYLWKNLLLAIKEYKSNLTLSK